ncbi:hypothetical protein DDZ15_11545 [Rhodohalobacter mucosus]|uniref:Uncharacterized protein n=2 Tax=Rhodohalobacter mucosus TaxID=2079485 RepID=A0A316TRC6_9BACT|nr:hypothetical protein DDZ15_11545 [Rhodohalobacter mucosus]
MPELTIQIAQYLLLAAGAASLLVGLVKLFKRNKGWWLWLITGIALTLTYAYLFDPEFFGLLA